MSKWREKEDKEEEARLERCHDGEPSRYDLYGDESEEDFWGHEDWDDPPDND